MAATPDGSKVFFTSCEKLTDDSTATGPCDLENQGDLYSYDVETNELTDLTVDSNAGDPGAPPCRGYLASPMTAPTLTSPPRVSLHPRGLG